MIRYVSTWMAQKKVEERRKKRPGRKQELNESSLLNHIVWWVLKRLNYMFRYTSHRREKPTQDLKPVDGAWIGLDVLK